MTDELETVWKVGPGISQALSRSLLRGTGDELRKQHNPQCPCPNLKKALSQQKLVVSAVKKVGHQ